MKRTLLDDQWSFWLNPSSRPDPKEEEPMVVDLPHDFSIIQEREPQCAGGASNGFFPGGTGLYEKKLFAPKDWENQSVILEFEGVYMNAAVRVNGHLVAQHPYGYTTFHCDIGPYIRCGEENRITVFVNNSAQPNTRWYSGSGIYRHVWLLTGSSVHIAPWGVFASTPKAGPALSTVHVETMAANTGSDASDVSVRSTLQDQNGVEAGRSETALRIEPDDYSTSVQDIHVRNPRLWSPDDPYLYKLHSEIVRDGAVIDSTETMVGLREIAFDAENGFRLNGNEIKMKGGCVHHDCGLLGSAAHDRAEERKVQLLRSNGFNAVRCAHNPPSPAFLDACDRLGMLVIDEAFDCWREGKKPNDYSLYFQKWWQEDMHSMVLRDRNHPSIIMWSTGNEIIERDGRSQGCCYANELADYVRSLDDTRPITNALCGLWDDPPTLDKTDPGTDAWAQVTAGFTEPLDVVGYNYLLHRYEKDGQLFPGRVLYGAETFPKDAYDYWEEVTKHSYVVGDFVWTALDYLGEAGIGHVWHHGEVGFLGDYPWHQAFCGDLDICGFKRPQSYFRDCVWGHAEAPYIAVYKPQFYQLESKISEWGWPDVTSSWSWPGMEGMPTAVEVYSRDEEVELFLNAKSLGRQPAGHAHRYTAVFELEYEPGELMAVGMNSGEESSRTILRTAGRPTAIELTPDRSFLNGQGDDLCFVTLELLDQNGNPAHHAEDRLFITASGPGELIAVGNGCPTSEEMYIGNQRRVYEGRAMAVVRANQGPGQIVLCASADGIPASSVTITVS